MYRTLTNGFKGKIKKGEIVEKICDRNGVADICTNDKVDKIMIDDLEKIEIKLKLGGVL